MKIRSFNRKKEPQECIANIDRRIQKMRPLMFNGRALTGVCQLNSSYDPLIIYTLQSSLNSNVFSQSLRLETAGMAQSRRDLNLAYTLTPTMPI